MGWTGIEVGWTGNEVGWTGSEVHVGLSVCTYMCMCECGRIGWG